MDKPIYIVVTPFFPTPTSWRGAYCYDFVKALMRTNKFDVLVFSEGDGSDYEIGGLRVYTFKAKRLPSNIFPNLFAKWNQRSFVEKVEDVRRIEGWSVDNIVVCHGHTANYGIYPLALKKICAKCKTLLHHHDLQSFGLNGGCLSHFWPYNFIMFPILRKLHEQIDCHVFISEASRRSFLKAPDANWTKYSYYKRQMRALPWRPVQVKDSIVLHNGVDGRLFRVGSNKEDRASSSFTIGCVSNFQPLKDHITLLRAAEVLSTDWHLDINYRFVGSGETLDACKRFAIDHNINAEFLSEVRHEELAAFYETLDLFVLPSYFEGYGCVYTEAYACGVPFMACKGQGIEDIIPVEDRDVWLFSPRDYVGLASMIRGYIDSRPVQQLRENQSIDLLVTRFVNELEERKFF